MPGQGATLVHFHRTRNFGFLAAVASLAALTACGSSAPSSASGLGLYEEGTLTVGSDVSYPPQEFYDAHHQAVGFDVDIARAVATKMGLKLAVVNQSFDGIIPALNAKKYDVILSAMTVNDKRKAQVNFVPYFQAGEALVVKKGSAYRPQKLTDLCGHTVAIEKGTAEADEIKTITCPGGPPKAQEYTADTEAAEQLTKGTVDVYFTDSPVADYDAKQRPDLEVSSPVLETAPEGIAIRKGNGPLVDAVQKAFNEIRADGQYKTILEKWNVSDGALP